jgi:hypothetical protein
MFYAFQFHSTTASEVLTDAHTNMQDDMTHAFVVEFASEADRDYYTLKDPAHMAFKQSAVELFEKGLVVDFTNGVF